MRCAFSELPHACDSALVGNSVLEAELKALHMLCRSCLDCMDRPERVPPSTEVQECPPSATSRGRRLKARRPPPLRLLSDTLLVGHCHHD